MLCFSSDVLNYCFPDSFLLNAISDSHRSNWKYTGLKFEDLAKIKELECDMGEAIFDVLTGCPEWTKEMHEKLEILSDSDLISCVQRVIEY